MTPLKRRCETKTWRLFAVVLSLLTCHLSPAFAAAFDPLGYGADAKAVGGAYAAGSDQGSAAYWNPPGLAAMKQPQITSSFSDLYGLGLLRYATAGYSQPNLGGGTLSFHVLRLQTVGEASFLPYSETTYLFAYGRRIWRTIDAGAAFRYYALTSDHRASGLGFDAGLRWSTPRDRARLAVTWQDLNQPRLRYDNGTTDILPASVRAGGMLKVGPISEFLIEEDWRNRKPTYSAGMAHHLVNRLFVLRAGLNRTKGQQQWSFTAGGGLHFKLLDVDYAWENDDALGNTQTFGASLRFGS